VCGFHFSGVAVLVIVTACSGFLVGLAWAMMVAAYNVLGFFIPVFLLDLFLLGFFFVSWFGELCLYGWGEAGGVVGVGTRGRATYSVCY